MQKELLMNNSHPIALGEVNLKSWRKGLSQIQAMIHKFLNQWKFS